MRVAEEVVEWKEGVAVVFDDSFLHSVFSQPVAEDEGRSGGLIEWSGGGGEVPDGNDEWRVEEGVFKEEGEMDTADLFLRKRALLIVDLWNPDLTLSERETLTALFSSTEVD